MKHSFKVYKFFYIFIFSLLLIGCGTSSVDPKIGEGTVSIPSYNIKAPQSGKILGLILDKGERISKNQPLFAIEAKELDQEVEKISTELVKAQAELQAMEKGSPVTSTGPDIATAESNYQQAQIKATKMQKLLAAGAVSRRQAEMAQQELQEAASMLQLAKQQSLSLQPASPEAIEAQKQKISALELQQQKLLQKQQQNEALSPCTAIVTDKKVQNGQLAVKEQVVLVLASQDTAVINIKNTNNKLNPLVGDPVLIKTKDNPLVFNGKITEIDKGQLIVTSTEKPESIKSGTQVIVELKQKE